MGRIFCIFTASLLALLLGAQARAGDALQEGMAAYKAKAYRRALASWEPLAELGDPKAQYLLSRLYEGGLGVVRDRRKALEWLRSAAEGGAPAAQFNLGNHYNQGDLVPLDQGRAAHWWRLAAEQGLVPAQYNLGMLYFYGSGVAKDRRRARDWFEKAAARGSKRALEALEQMDRQQATAPKRPATRREKGDRVRRWLLSQPPEALTIQIYASEDLAAVRRFLAAHRLDRQVAAYRFERRGRPWVGVVYGRFDDMAAARRAIARLPADIRSGGPWVRRFGDVQALVNKPGP